MKPITVSELVEKIRYQFFKIGDIMVLGEISNLKNHPSGHTYFTLKDDKNQIECVLFYSRKINISILPENGKEFIIFGHLDYYGQGGKTEIIVEDLEPAGEGRLAIILHERIKKLAKLGLFSPEHKKNLPKYPEKIGIVSSIVGAAIQDMIKTLKDRFPPVKIIVRPTLVQGDKAAEDIANAIKEFNDFGDVDVIIVGRGGGKGTGQREDLWAFNEEIVAYAIYNSKIPVVSAVGHEKDTTIADLVADVRAITPTDAANKVVPSKDEILRQFLNYRRIMINNLNRRKRELFEKIRLISDLRVFKYPFSMVDDRYLELDRIYEKMIYSMNSKFMLIYHKINSIKLAKPRIIERKNYIANLEKNLKREIETIFKMNKGLLNSYENRLFALSPINILKKGYSIVFKDSKVIKSVKELSREDKIKLRLSDGEREAEVV